MLFGALIALPKDHCQCRTGAAQFKKLRRQINHTAILRNPITGIRRMLIRTVRTYKYFLKLASLSVSLLLIFARKLREALGQI